MRITVIHGQMHKGSTYEISKQVVDTLATEITHVSEFFLPKDMPHACVGCYNCFQNGAKTCPHYEAMAPITEALEASDVILLESPCYVFGMTGQMKTFLDHMAYRWLSHRPHEKMFQKVGIVVSTAAGAGARKTVKAMAENLFFWGVPVVFKYGVNVAGSQWADVSMEKKAKINKSVQKMSVKIKKAVQRKIVPIKMKVMFNLMQKNQKANTWIPRDKQHWEERGWLENKRPYR